MAITIMAILAFGVAGLCCWRIVVGAVAARPIGDRLRYAVGLAAAPTPGDFNGADFALLERLFAAAGALGGSGRDTILIRAYYLAVHRLAGVLPSLTPWSEREMKICSRYLAARIERLLATNAACSRRMHTL
jgi:hypothetical protein